MAIKGYVVKFNERSLLLYDEWYERVAKGAFAKGAFAKSLEENTIKALWNHNSDIVLGSTKSRTNYSDRALSEIKIQRKEDILKFGNWIYDNSSIYLLRKRENYDLFLKHYYSI